MLHNPFSFFQVTQIYRDHFAILQSLVLMVEPAWTVSENTSVCVSMALVKRIVKLTLMNVPAILAKMELRVLIMSTATLATVLWDSVEQTARQMIRIALQRELSSRHVYNF